VTIARRPSPFGELLSLRTAMDRLFEDSFVQPFGWGSSVAGAAMPLDVSTTAGTTDHRAPAASDESGA
jgi:hypothetical protein